MFDTTNMSPFAENHNRVGEGASRATLSAIPPKYCRGKSGLSRVELALLAYVIDHPEPWQQGSRSAIAEDCDCAPNSVPRAARRLIALELIETVPGGGARNTIYRLGRNMEVTESIDTRNADVSRNLDGTTVETLKLRASNREAPAETTTTDSVVTQVTGGRNIPPLQPPLNTSSMSEGEPLPERVEPSFERGQGGGLFGDAPAAPKRARKPKASKRPKREKFYATEESMPQEMSEEMAAYATSKGLYNGTRAEQYGKFCRWHIREGTLIRSLEGRWETWVDNWAKSNPKRPDGIRPGYKLAGFGADGKARYVKDQRTNVYR